MLRRGLLGFCVRIRDASREQTSTGSITGRCLSLRLTKSSECIKAVEYGGHDVIPPGKEVVDFAGERDEAVFESFRLFVESVDRHLVAEDFTVAGGASPEVPAIVAVTGTAQKVVMGDCPGIDWLQATECIPSPTVERARRGRTVIETVFNTQK